MEEKIRLYEDFIRTLKRVMQMYRHYELEEFEAQLEMASTFDEYFPWAKESEEIYEDENIIHLGELIEEIDKVQEADKKFAENVLKKVNVAVISDRPVSLEGMFDDYEDEKKVCFEVPEMSPLIIDKLEDINIALREIAQQLNDRR